MSELLNTGSNNPQSKFNIDLSKFKIALLKFGADSLCNPSNLLSDLVEVGASLGYSRTTPDIQADLWINCALIRAMLDIAPIYCEEWKNLTAEDKKSHSSDLLSSRPLDDLKFEIDRDFLDNPKTFAGLSKAQEWMESWLNLLVENPADAQSMSARLPSYFVCALHDELRDCREKYQLFTNYFLPTLVSPAYQKEMSWRRYEAWLDKQLDEPIFNEAFGTRKLYVPLSAYCIQKQKNSISGSLETKEIRYVRDLTSEMNAWLEDNRPNTPNLRSIIGGPGSGKSTFTKHYAAQVAAQGKFKVWHISLNHLNLTDNLRQELQDIASECPYYLQDNPLREEKILIIFDGLDELSLSGKPGSAAANKFIMQLRILVNNPNNQRQLKVLVSGREPIIQEQISTFSQPCQVWHLLPYNLLDVKAPEYQFEPPDLQEDLRNEWWKKYGELIGKEYKILPSKLNKSSLHEITTQPILNYLMAISEYFCKDEISSKKITRNQIYESLFRQVHERGWAPRHKANGSGVHLAVPIKFEEFQLVLEEVALCAWHGKGLIVTESTIISHCNDSNNEEFKRLLPDFLETDNKETKITRLLVAFYFKRCGDRIAKDEDKTFEFTHKSFGEFLVAKRFVRAVEYLSSNYQDRNSHYKEKEVLRDWIKICKSGTLDSDILEFIREEISERHYETPDLVDTWQETCSELISYLLQSGLPMEELGGLTFHEMTNQAIQAEIALLALLNACALCTKKLSKINWGDNQSFGIWLAKMQGRQKSREASLVTTCLSWLDLHKANLNRANLNGAVLTRTNLFRSNLKEADLNRAILEEANLDEADLDGASLVKTNLNNAHLNRAILNGVRLDGAKLNGASLERAHLKMAHLNGTELNETNLNFAELFGANLKGAKLIRAQLHKANLHNAYLVNTNLSSANLKEAKLIRTKLGNAHLDGAELIGANLEGANLKGTSLKWANLDGATLTGASLDETKLEGASLKWVILDDRTDFHNNIIWNSDTKWENNMTIFRSVQNIPKDLKKELRIT